MLKSLNASFHHLGLACRDLDAEARAWLDLGYHAEAPDFEDPIQRVRGRFLAGPGPRLELLAGCSSDSPIEGLVRRNIKIYHQAWEVPRFDDAVAKLRNAKYRLVTSPAPAVAFEGRRIVFFFMPNMNLIELIEQELTP